MAIWKMRSGDGAVEIYVNAVVDGLVTGMVEIESKSFTVNGQWAPRGRTNGRDFSGLTLCGSDSRSAPEFIAAAGVMKGEGSAPEMIAITIVRTNSAQGKVRSWEGELRPEYV